MGHRPAVVLSLILLAASGAARAGEGAPVNTWTGAAPSGACKGSRVATIAGTGKSYCCVSSTWQPCGRAAELVSSHDTRAVAAPPQDFAAGAEFDFKADTADGLSDGAIYHGVLTFRPYGTGTDLSGGPVHQLGFTANGNLWRRISTSATTWGSWTKVNDAAGDILSKLLGVDGAGSGLDADLLDGLHASAFAQLSGATFSGSVIVQGDGVNVSPPSGIPYLRLYHQSLAGTEKRGLQLSIDTSGGVVEFWSPAGLKQRFYNAVEVSGSITASGDITAYGSVSDARLKKNVAPISGALGKALSLRGVEYDWREELLSAAGFDPVRGRVTGFLAQDVQRVLPDAVFEAKGKDGATYLGVRYERTVPLLLEAIRELNAKVEQLEARQ